ncbi:MAG: hypothetical protein ACLQQ4_16335 [Bacteroidia bacterium]
MIYDCFTFFNELDILEIRLNILNDVVDKFVLVEATRTHQGKEKPLFFTENKERYRKFLDKIIHVVVDTYPSSDKDYSWTLERHQREMIAEGLKNCASDDIIMVSDADEIPDPEQVKLYAGKRGVKVFYQRMYYYFINCRNTSIDDKYRWQGTVMCRINDNLSPQEMRNLSIIYAGKYSDRFRARLYSEVRLLMWQLKNLKRAVPVYKGGWHFSYLGGVKMIINKLEAFAHAEYNSAEYKDPAKIEQALKEGKDIFGRGYTYQFVPLDNAFPQYILNNREKYRELIKE